MKNAEIWNSKNTNSLADAEIERTVKSIYTAHQRMLSLSLAHGGSDNLDDSLIDIRNFNPEDILQKGSELVKYDVEIEWLADKLIPAQSINLLYGKGGIGKTWLALLMARAVSTGEKFLGLNTKQSPVIYVDFENPFPMLVDRLRKIGADDVSFWHCTNAVKPPRLDGPNWTAYQKLGRGLIIFDTMRASHGKEENNSLDMRNIMTRLKVLRDMGFTIILLHHTPKSNARTYKGNTAILDLCDQALSLHEVDNGTYRFGTQDKTRYEPFHVFLEFAKDKGFILARDPDTDFLESIRTLIVKNEKANQGQLFEMAKNEFGIGDKERFLRLLKKGEGIYWNVKKGLRGKAKWYCLITEDEVDTAKKSSNIISISSRPQPVIERRRRRHRMAAESVEPDEE